MKRALFPLCLLFWLTGFAQTGYEIKVTFKPFKKQYIYLGHYFGKTYPIIDSALLNDAGQAVFKGNKKLPGGIYLVGYPKKTGFFEILVDKQQHFSVIADTATIKKGVKFLNSPDNNLFVAYQQHVDQQGKQILALQNQLKQPGVDSAAVIEKLKSLDKTVANFRDSITKKYPKSVLTALLVAMREPQLTGRLKDPTNREDSLAAYTYFKTHYWDGVNFWDGRLAYTTFFEDKVDKYFNQLVVQHPDSIIFEIDKMMGPATASPEMTQLLLLKFVNRYLNQKYMYEDAVFVHLFEKYFASRDYKWLTPQGRKLITDRAYNLMANIMGAPASDIQLPDSTGGVQSLYADTSKYIVVAFWDPGCGHCKEVLPKLDSLYRVKWGAAGVKIFAVAKETDTPKKEWLKFISENNLLGWTHVYYSKQDDKARTDVGIPGYSQLYDVKTYPTLYLLDREKRIIAKQLSYDQIDEVLDVRLKDGQ